jgi:hypothetical protein
MPSKHKSEDYKLSAVEYYLVGDISQLKVCEIFGAVSHLERVTGPCICIHAVDGNLVLCIYSTVCLIVCLRSDEACPGETGHLCNNVVPLLQCSNVHMLPW